MKRLVVGALAVAAVAGGIWVAQTLAAQKSGSGADTDAALIEADRALRQALATGDKPAAIARMDRRFAFTDHTGKTRHRAQVVEAPAPAFGEDDADVTVRRYGRVAIVAATIGSPGKDLESAARRSFVHVWVKRRMGWRALLYQDSAVGPAPPVSPAASASCGNPCKTLPYRPKSAAEQDIIAAFQAIETAVTRNDADAWARHVADDFVVYRSTGPPSTKADRIAFIRGQQQAGAASGVGEIQSMQLWVFGNAAVMAADHVWAEGARAPYRAARVWVRRDAGWQLALSQQTSVAP